MRVILLLLLISVNLVGKPLWKEMPDEAYALKKKYLKVQRIFFAFDYGHAYLYDKLIALKRAGKPYNEDEVETKLLGQILKIIREGAQEKTNEEKIAPDYALEFSDALGLFDWSHYLHQFSYDLLINRTSVEDATTKIAAVYDYYLSEESLVISDRCFSMKFMDSLMYQGKTFSKAFRNKFPRLNDLIWSYHWLQIYLYKVLLMEPGTERDLEVDKMLTRFFGILDKIEKGRVNFPTMPEMEKVAGPFVTLKGSAKNSLLYAKLANLFDNLHMLHDVLSDIIISDVIPKDKMMEEGRLYAKIIQTPPEKFQFLSDRCYSERNKTIQEER